MIIFMANDQIVELFLKQNVEILYIYFHELNNQH